VLSVLLGLLAVLAIIAVLAWALRHLFRVGVGAEGLVRVLGSTSLGARERVVLLQVGGEQVLVGVAPGRVQTLHVLDEPVTLPAPGEAPGFQAQLARFLGRPPVGERSE
jgi:flagellar protein FliO/FliZ